MAEQAPYRVDVWDLDEFFRVLATFPLSQQERVTEFMANHFATRPKAMIPGVLKALRGPWSGTYQLECGGGRRLLYEIDEIERAVRIVYLGSHPEWERRRPWTTGR